MARLGDHLTTFTWFKLSFSTGIPVFYYYLLFWHICLCKDEGTEEREHQVYCHPLLYTSHPVCITVMERDRE